MLKKYLFACYSRAFFFEILLIISVAGGLVFAYIQGKGLVWQFDDQPNLSGLANVSSHIGLFDFIFGGIAGPVGRPLSLLAFIPNYADWPDNPWGFAAGNLLLHGLNTLLAALLFFRLWGSVSIPFKGEMMPLWVKGGVGALIWASLAIHTTGILMPVQRMTLVSAFFVLLTLWLFAGMRQRFAGARSYRPVVLVSLVVGVGAVLAILGKENGALTISLVAVIETFFFSRLAPVGSRKIWRLWTVLAWLALPVLLIGKYLIFGWTSLLESYEYFRPFSLSERLATQSVIIWEYLRQIFLPRAALLGPFHDGHFVYNWTMWQPWASIIAWPLLFWSLMKLAISGVETARVFVFALTFYLVAHQVESTFIPLELYFEHRNYIASLGLSFAFGFVFFGFYKLKNKAIGLVAVPAAFFVFFSTQIFSVYQVASLFGNPMLGAEMWHRYHPASQRAAQTLSWQYRIHGFDTAALKILDDFIERQPEQIGVRHQAVFLSCVNKAESKDMRNQRFEDLATKARGIDYASYLITGLKELGDAIRAGECSGISLEEYYYYLQMLLNNIAVANSGITRNHVDFELSLTAKKMGLDEEAIYYARQAFYDAPAINSGQRVAVLLFQQQRLDEAISWIDEALNYAPDGVRRWAWQMQFASMRSAIANVQSMTNYDSR